jgi:hypothetical protein
VANLERLEVIRDEGVHIWSLYTAISSNS